MAKSFVAVAAAAAISLVTLSNAVKAADREVPRRAAAAHSRPIYCGCCGCLHVRYDHHRELLSTYGTHFDPRNYDQTEAHYYFGGMRAYPRYWTDYGGRESLQ